MSQESESLSMQAKNGICEHAVTTHGSNWITFIKEEEIAELSA